MNNAIYMRSPSQAIKQTVYHSILCV